MSDRAIWWLLAIGFTSFFLAGAPSVLGLNGNYEHDYYVCTH